MNIKKKLTLILVQLFMSSFLFCLSQSKSPIKIWHYLNDNENAQHFEVDIWEHGLAKFPILNLAVKYISGQFNSECWEDIETGWNYQHRATCRYVIWNYKIESPDPNDFIPYSGILDLFPQTIEFDIKFESQEALFNIPGKPDFKGTNEIPFSKKKKEIHLTFNFETMSGEATFGNLKSTEIKITKIKRINIKKISTLELWGAFLWETDNPDCCE